MTSARAEPHRELIVWRKAMLLAVAVYDVVRRLSVEERFALGLQMRRAVVSVASNIAEGKGRRTKADFARFLSIARGSARELETMLELAEMCRLIDSRDTAESRALLGEVTRMLTAMLRKFAPF
jgi:four helix bundle protein